VLENVGERPPAPASRVPPMLSLTPPIMISTFWTLRAGALFTSHVFSAWIKWCAKALVCELLDGHQFYMQHRYQQSSETVVQL